MTLERRPGPPDAQLRGVDAGSTLGRRPTGTVEAVPASEVDGLLRQLPRLLGDPDTDEPPALVWTDEVIGAGAMGVVRCADQPTLARQVAVKALRPGGDDDQVVLALREARVTGALEHPAVVPVYMAGRDDDGSPLIVMKRIAGTAWSDFVEGVVPVDATDPLAWHLGVLVRACRAVEYAHSKGVLHRDLKPENVMIGAFGEVYVLDWGLAVTLRDDDPMGLPRAADVDWVGGTPGYMAPEMIASEIAPLGVRTDGYLLGAVLHEIVTGRRRHAGSDALSAMMAAVTSGPVDYGPDVPAELAVIANRATARDPEDRYPDVAAFRSAVEAYLEHRHSLELVRAADERLAELEALLDRGDDREVRVHEVAAECRFAFRQALASWPGNEAARAGHERVLDRMAAYEEASGNPAGALVLVLQMERPDPERVAALEEAVSVEAAARDELERHRLDADVSIGQHNRSRLLALLGAGFGLVGLALGWLDRAGVFSAEHGTFLGLQLALGVTVVVATHWWGEILQANALNRRFLQTLWITAATGVLLWLVAGSGGLPFAPTLAHNMLLYGVIIAMAATGIDGRLVGGALPYAAAYAFITLWPRWAYEGYGVATAAAMGWTAAVWRDPRP